MRIPKPVWIAVALSALAGASGFVWLPVPIGLVQDALDEQAEGFEVSGRARIRWAAGVLRAEDLRLRWRGRPLAAAETLELRVDLRPRAPAFGRPWRLEASGLEAELDAARLDALLALRQEPSDPVAMEISLGGGSAAWIDGEGRRWEARLEHVRGIVRTGAAAEAETALEAECSLVLPAPARARLRLRAIEDGAFEASLAAETERLDAFAPLAPGLESLRADARASLRAHLGPDFLRFAVEASAARVEHDALPVPLADCALAASGDLRSRAELRAAASAAGCRAEVVSRLARAGGSGDDAIGAWETEADARVSAQDLGGELEALLREHAPAAAEILVALGLRGSPSADAGFRGRVSAAGLAPGWRLAAAAPLAGIGLRYAGFLDDEGERFSLPYPVAATGGFAAWNGEVVLVCADGVAGEAGGDPHGQIGPATRVGARCAVTTAEPEARVWLDLAARAVRLDEKLGAALQTNPETASLWFRLGAPRGQADADFALRPAPGGESLWSLHLFGSGLQAEPPDFGLPVALRRVDARVDAGGVRFEAEAEAAGAAATLRGVSRATQREGDAEWAVTVAGAGYPAREARERLSAVVALPPEAVQIDPGAAPRWDVQARALLREGETPRPSLLVTASCADAAPAWPERDLRGSGWSVRAAVARAAGGETLAALEPAAGVWNDARLEAGGSLRFAVSADGGAAPPRGTLTGLVHESQITQEAVQGALLLLEADAWAAGLRFGGKVSAIVELPVEDPSALRARLDLNPLHVVVQPGALGPTAAREPARYMLLGALRLRDGAVTSPRLTLRGDDLDLVIQDGAGSLGEQGLALHGTAQSARGIRLRPHLEVVAPQRVLQSFDRIGLDGRIQARNVAFDLVWPSGGAPRATASGVFQLSDFRIGGPPPVQAGAGTLRCDSFAWNGPEDFRGAFRLEDGEAVVSGVRVASAKAQVTLAPDRVTVGGFEAAALDGRVFTDFALPDGSRHQGAFSLGLAGRAAVRADFGFEGFRLERLGEELGYRGPLAGRLDGKVDVASESPSPVDYRGAADLHITDGVLGAVPVLSRLWRLLGVEAPVFNEGRLKMQFLSEGRILVENLQLLHPLLEVTGERMITMDSYLGLKVTVRTFGFLGRLPLIKDLLDLIVEQDVYGPASAPRLRQRGLGKIFSGDPERVAFPLWVPRTPLPERTRSPLLPEGRVFPPRVEG